MGSLLNIKPAKTCTKPAQIAPHTPTHTHLQADTHTCSHADISMDTHLDEEATHVWPGIFGHKHAEGSGEQAAGHVLLAGGNLCCGGGDGLVCEDVGLIHTWFAMCMWFHKWQRMCHIFTTSLGSQRTQADVRGGCLQRWCALAPVGAG